MKPATQSPKTSTSPPPLVAQVDPQSVGIDEERKDQAVRARAYAIWASEGKPEGRQDDHWRRAEEELGGRPRITVPKPAETH